MTNQYENLSAQQLFSILNEESNHTTKIVYGRMLRLIEGLTNEAKTGSEQFLEKLVIAEALYEKLGEEAEQISPETEDGLDFEVCGALLRAYLSGIETQKAVGSGSK